METTIFRGYVSFRECNQLGPLGFPWFLPRFTVLTSGARAPRLKLHLGDRVKVANLDRIFRHVEICWVICSNTVDG